MQSHNGDVELTVTLDTSGLKKETEKIKKEIEQGVKSEGTNIKPQTDVKPIQEVAKSAQETSSQFNKLVEQSDFLSNKLKDVQSQLESVKNTVGESSEQYRKLLEEAEKIKSTLETVSSLMADIKKNSASTDLSMNMDSVQKDTEDINEEMDRLQAILDRNRQKAEDLKNELAESDNDRVSFVDPESMKNSEEALEFVKQFEEEAQNAQQASKDAVSETTKQFEEEYSRFIEYITAAENKAREMSETIAGLKDVGVDPEELAKMEKEYDALINKIALMRQSIKMGSTAWNEMTPKERLTQFVYKLKTGFQELGASVKDKVIPALKNFASSVGKGTMTALQTGLRKATSLFRKLTPHINAANKGLGTSIKQILKYALGIGSLVMLFNKLRAAVKEGVNNLAQWKDGNNEVNENLSNFISLLLQLKNQLAAAFAPIITTVVPILNTFINSLIEAGNYLSQFLAKLTGQDTWIKALKVQKNYADSLNKTGKAAKDASGSLAKFDDLDVLNKKDTSGGGSTVDPNDMFEEVPISDIEDSVDDWIEKLKIAWQSGDFTDIGSAVGEWLKNVLTNIPWGDIQDSARKIAHSLATFLNGFFETEGLGAEIGKTIAEALNTAFISVNEFVHTLHWSSIGEFIAESLLSFLDTLKFDEAGQALGGALRGMIDLAFSLVSKFTEEGGWEKISTGIITFVNNFIQELNEIDPETGLSGWEKAGATLYDLAYGLIDTLGDTIEGLPWEDFGKGLSQFLSQIDFTMLAGELFDCANSLIDGIAEAVKQLQPIQLAGLAAAIATVIAGLSIGVSSVHIVIMGATATIGFNVGKVIGEALFPEDAVFYKTFSWEDFFGSPEDTVNGIKMWADDVADAAWEVIIKPLIAVFGGIPVYLAEGFSMGWENATNPFTAFIDMCKGAIEWIKDIFGIHSPSTVMRDIAINIVQGLIDGFAEMKNKVGEIWTNIKDAIFEKITLIKDSVMTKVDAFKLAFLGAFVTLQSKFVSIWNNIKDGVKNPINAIIGLFEGMVNKIIDGLNGLIDKANNFSKSFKFTNPFTKETTSMSLNIGKLNHVSIPRLAQGAVIPPNREFMAMLGDQRQGTNIEAPLDTITEAFAEVVGSMRSTGNAVMTLDGQTFARLVVPYVMNELDRRGYNVKVLEG